MRLRALTLMSALFALSIPALADTYTYTYTGNDFLASDIFAVPGADYTTSDSVTGSFTLLAPLGDNLTLATITPSSFSFTDGINTLNNTDTFFFETFEVGTNASGQITTWKIVLGNLNPFEAVVATQNTAAGANDSGDLETSSGQSGSGSTNSPGSWSFAAATSPTPEPSTFVLLGTGVLGLAGAVRRKLLNS